VLKFKAVLFLFVPLRRYNSEDQCRHLHRPENVASSFGSVSALRNFICADLYNINIHRPMYSFHKCHALYAIKYVDLITPVMLGDNINNADSHYVILSSCGLAYVNRNVTLHNLCATLSGL
jgi:hypothetical protein